MTAILAAIAWSRTNWRLALTGLGAVALLVAAWWLFDAGRASMKTEQDRASLQNLRDRSTIDDDAKSLPPLALCKRAGGGAYCDSLPDKR